MKDRIKTMLGNGLSPSVTALACGCTPAYVSQLMADEDFAKEVAELRFASLTQATDRDTKADKLEDALLAKIEELLPYMTKPMEVVRAYMALNGAKRRGAVHSQELPQQTQVIQLFLPQKAVTNFRISSTNEIVEVNDTTLVSMQAPQLMETLKNKLAAKQEGDTNDRHINYVEGGEKRIPATIPAAADSSVAASLI